MMQIRQHPTLMTILPRHEVVFRDVILEELVIDVIDELWNHGEQNGLEVVESFDIAFREVDELEEEPHAFPEIGVENVFVELAVTRVEVARHIWEVDGADDVVVFSEVSSSRVGRGRC